MCCILRAVIFNTFFYEKYMKKYTTLVLLAYTLINSMEPPQWLNSVSFYDHFFSEAITYQQNQQWKKAVKEYTNLLKLGTEFDFLTRSDKRKAILNLNTCLTALKHEKDIEKHMKIC